MYQDACWIIANLLVFLKLDQSRGQNMT